MAVLCEIEMKFGPNGIKTALISNEFHPELASQPNRGLHLPFEGRCFIGEILRAFNFVFYLIFWRMFRVI